MSPSLKPVNDDLFKRLASDGQHVGADGRTLVAGGRTAKAMLADLDVACAATAALDRARRAGIWAGSAGERVWASGCRPGVQRHLRLAILHRLPERVVDDPQLRHVMDSIRASSALAARPAFAGVRILHVAQTVPDQPADDRARC